MIFKKILCNLLNIKKQEKMMNGLKMCCDFKNSKDCYYLRLIDIGHVDYPVCIYEIEGEIE